MVNHTLTYAMTQRTMYKSNRLTYLKTKKTRYRHQQTLTFGGVNFISFIDHRDHGVCYFDVSLARRHTNREKIGKILHSHSCEKNISGQVNFVSLYGN